MKNFWKSICVLFTPLVFLTACGSNKTYHIYFSGVGVSFEKATDVLRPNQTYTIGVTPLGGYNLEQDDFTITIGDQDIEQGSNTWNWANNVLTIKGGIVTNDISVSADASVITYSASVTTSSPNINVGEYDTEVSILKDFVVNITVTDNTRALKATLEINGEPSTKYTLNNSGDNEYEFKIDQDDIIGDINLDLTLVANEITVSKTEVNFLTYGNDVVTYEVPSSLDSDQISADTTGTVFSITLDKSSKRIKIDSKLNGVGGTDTITFKCGTMSLATEITVNVKAPTNIDEAQEAFTLAAIKCEPNKAFDVNFNFNNTLDEEDFELSQEIYGRMRVTDFIDYNKGNRFNRFKVNTNASFATIESGMVPGDEYYRYNPSNINYLNRKLTSPISHTLYIDTVERELEVTNSEELFWAVEHGYKPSIPSGKTNLIALYNDAQNICAAEINPAWTEFEKMRILFDKLESMTHYDYWVLDFNDWWTHKGYFLEGVFDDGGKAVCDGFAKAYALLCGIEGLPCIRSYGFTADSGHAWNYIKIDGGWYLTCPTWCKAGCKISDNRIINLMDYEAFGASKNYFADLGEPFSDLAFTTISKSSNPYCSSTILSLDKTSGNRSYLISNNYDANAIKTVVSNVSKKTTINEGYVCIAYANGTSEEMVDAWARTIAGGAAPCRYAPITPISSTDPYIHAWIYITKS